MRLSQLFVSGLSLPLLAIASFAQTTPQTAPAAPASQAAPVPALQLHDLPSDPHTLTPEEQAQQKEEQQQLELVRLARAEANWGPAESAPGMSMQLKEITRAKTANGTAITWQLIGKGFTPDMQLTLVRWPLNLNITPIMSGITVDASGTAVCSAAAAAPQAPTTSPTRAIQAPACTASMKAGTPVEITSTVAKGEPVRVALVAADRKHGAAINLVPFPIETEDKGCKLEVTLGSKEAELVIVRGEGLKTDPTATLGTESFGQKHPMQAKITPQGTFVAALTPWAPGHDTGDTVLFYQSAGCEPTLSFHWGKDSYKAE
jgi:hypothetical protein